MVTRPPNKKCQKRFYHLRIPINEYFRLLFLKCHVTEELKKRLNNS